MSGDKAYDPSSPVVGFQVALDRARADCAATPADVAALHERVLSLATPLPLAPCWLCQRRPEAPDSRAGLCQECRGLLIARQQHDDRMQRQQAAIAALAAVDHPATTTTRSTP